MDAHSEKVILDSGKLEPNLKEAIRRAHSGEDPHLTARPPRNLKSGMARPINSAADS